MSLYSRIEGSGKPLLIIHGFLGMSDNWKTLGTQFAAEGYEVHALDMRNHGKSFHSDAFSYQLMADDVYEYCQQHNLTHIDLIGHSMGGKVAMLVAVTYPELVDKLVVADIGPKQYAPHHQDILKGLSAVDFSQKPGRSEVEAIVETYIPDFGTRQFLLKNLYWKEPGQLAFRFNLEVFVRNQEVIGESLPYEGHFEKPVLFLKGENSGYIKSEDAGLIEHHFPFSKIETIKNAGHWLHAENPTAFFDAVISFLRG